MKIRRAFVSVHNSWDLAWLVRGLIARGVEVSATPHGAAALAEVDVEVPVLARFDGLPDLLIANFPPLPLDPGEASDDQILRQIDASCTELVRYAALQPERTAVVVDPADYRPVLAALHRHGDLDLALRRRLAARALTELIAYDAGLVARLTSEPNQDGRTLPGMQVLVLDRLRDLAGSPAAPAGGGLYRSREAPSGALVDALDLGVSPVPRRLASYADGDLVWRMVQGWPQPAFALARCGALFAAAAAPSLARALACLCASAEGQLRDAFVGTNRAPDEHVARILLDAPVAGVIAPAYEAEASVLLDRSPRMALLGAVEGASPSPLRLHPVDGGFLMWAARDEDPFARGTYGSKRHADAAERSALSFAWRAGALLHGASAVLACCVDEACWIVGMASGQRAAGAAAAQVLGQVGSKAAACVLVSPAEPLSAEDLSQAIAAGVTAFAMPGNKEDAEEQTEAVDRAGAALLLV